jgi:hypothetical protein
MFYVLLIQMSLLLRRFKISKIGSWRFRFRSLTSQINPNALEAEELRLKKKQENNQKRKRLGIPEWYVHKSIRT